MHFYIKILCVQSWLFSFLSFYGQFLIGLWDGECIHWMLSFAAGYSTPNSDVLSKNPFLQLIFPSIALVFSGREWSLSRETSFTVWEALLWRERKYMTLKETNTHSPTGVGLTHSGNYVWCSNSNYFDKVIAANRRYIKCFWWFFLFFFNKILTCKCGSPLTVWIQFKNRNVLPLLFPLIWMIPLYTNQLINILFEVIKWWWKCCIWLSEHGQEIILKTCTRTILSMKQYIFLHRK